MASSSGDAAWKRLTGAKRISAEIKALQRSPLTTGTAPQISKVASVDDDLFRWRFHVKNFDIDVPAGRQLNADLNELGRRFGQDYLLMEAIFPQDYPTHPFLLRVVSPRCVMYTGHVTAGGSICIEALVPTGGPGGWRPDYGLEGLLVLVLANMLHAEVAVVRTPTGPGGTSGPLRIDLAHCGHSVVEYSMAEARSAYDRVVTNHGWSTRGARPAAGGAGGSGAAAAAAATAAAPFGLAGLGAPAVAATVPGGGGGGAGPAAAAGALVQPASPVHNTRSRARTRPPAPKPKAQSQSAPATTAAGGGGVAATAGGNGLAGPAAPHPAAPDATKAATTGPAAPAAKQPAVVTVDWCLSDDSDDPGVDLDLRPGAAAFFRNQTAPSGTAGMTGAKRSAAAAALTAAAAPQAATVIIIDSDDDSDGEWEDGGASGRRWRPQAKRPRATSAATAGGAGGSGGGGAAATAAAGPSSARPGDTRRRPAPAQDVVDLAADDDDEEDGSCGRGGGGGRDDGGSGAAGHGNAGNGGAGRVSGRAAGGSAGGAGPSAFPVMMGAVETDDEFDAGWVMDLTGGGRLGKERKRKPAATALTASAAAAASVLLGGGGAAGPSGSNRHRHQHQGSVTGVVSAAAAVATASAFGAAAPGSASTAAQQLAADEVLAETMAQLEEMRARLEQERRERERLQAKVQNLAVKKLTSAPGAAVSREGSAAAAGPSSGGGGAGSSDVLLSAALPDHWEPMRPEEGFGVKLVVLPLPGDSLAGAVVLAANPSGSGSAGAAGRSSSSPSGLPSLSENDVVVLIANGLARADAEDLLRHCSGNLDEAMDLAMVAVDCGGITALLDRQRKAAAEAEKAAAGNASEASAAPAAAAREKALGEEVERVLARFEKASGLSRNRVVRVERVQNWRLWTKYCIRKREIQALAAASGPSLNEFYLWHGTANNVVQAVVEHGFDLRVSNRGGALGEGIYFAANAQYSIAYTAQRNGGYSALPGTTGMSVTIVTGGAANTVVWGGGGVGGWGVGVGGAGGGLGMAQTLAAMPMPIGGPFLFGAFGAAAAPAPQPAPKPAPPSRGHKPSSSHRHKSSHGHASNQGPHAGASGSAAAAGSAAPPPQPTYVAFPGKAGAMMLCRVVLGRMAVGGPGIRKPPDGADSVYMGNTLSQGHQATAGQDAAWHVGRVLGDNLITAVFDNTQAYAEYIVHIN